MNTLILRFLEDTEDSFQHRESEALLVEAIPRRGETITIDDRFHAVANVIHNYDANGIEIHLGPGRDTAEDALVWLSHHKLPDVEGGSETEHRETGDSGGPTEAESDAEYKHVNRRDTCDAPYNS